MNVYKTLNNTKTHLITYGDPFQSIGIDVIVCITGCPGIPEFYKEFASRLHRNTKLPVCVIGHAGHDVVPDEETNTLKHEENLYNLDGQIDHKLDLINNHINKKNKLHVIGHSVGAWLLLELLNKNDYLTERISSVHLLFPTLQRMSESKMAILVKIIRKLHAFMLLMLVMLELIPKSVRTILISVYLKLNYLPLHYIERIFIYLNPEVEENALLLAYEFLDTVKTLNNAGIDKIQHVTNVIYSTTDHWAPLQHVEDLRRSQPNINFIEINVDHAFVLKSSDVVADAVSDCIKSKNLIV